MCAQDRHRSNRNSSAVAEADEDRSGLMSVESGEDRQTVPVSFVVFPPDKAHRNRGTSAAIAATVEGAGEGHFTLQINPQCSGADLKKRLRTEAGYASRWLQVVHLGRVLADHELVSTLDLSPPLNTIVLIPKPERLRERQEWWRHQERDLLRDSIDNALGNPHWPPLFVLGQTPQSANFAQRHEVWMRRIAQLSREAIVEAVPEPSFIEVEEGSELSATARLLQERAFAVNEVIASWEENGWELQHGVELIWVGTGCGRNVCILRR